MSNYYYLIAGLPVLTFDGLKPPFTLAEFKVEMAKHLTKADKRLFEYFQLEVDTKNLLGQLRNPGYEMQDGGKITADELQVLISGVQTEYKNKNEIAAYNQEAVVYNQALDDEYAKLDFYDSQFLPKKPKLKSKRFKTPFKNKNRRLPAYFEIFTRLYLTSVEKEEVVTIPWEDRLSSMFYEYAMKHANAFLSSWFEFNLNVNNIYTALTCRKYKLDRENYIVGHTETSNKLRTSTARDFELGEPVPYLTSLSHIAEDPDILQRELRTDQLKWAWLDEQMFPRVFNIDNVITYWLKIEMLERWSVLDKAEGETVFRQIVEPLKKSGAHVLEEFKRNNKK